MKHLLQIILVFLILNSCTSCTNDKTNKMMSDEEFKFVPDTTILEVINQYEFTELPEPFDISQLEATKGLYFTSGVLSKKEQKEYCDNSENGLYGRYNLISQNTNLEHPLVGTIDIYKPGKMSGWKASDTNQIVWKIHLKSDVISVWDSIHVGLSRDKVIQFGKTNNALCIKKGDFYYSCDFNNFSVLYNFKNDILTELTVTRNCDKEMKEN